MPTYEYECTKCERMFELFQSITDKPKKTIETDCRQCCNKAPVRRLLGIGGGLIFKGSGFYTTDYRSESYKKAAKAESGASDGKGTAADSNGKASEGKSSEVKSEGGKAPRRSGSKKGDAGGSRGASKSA
ncbi:MAG: zinc ribbon domain-containing protein [Phycisphaerales bacterium]|nr:MAG: zinc ribbon domain-containing protein [Phycisphaerales bacterium]